MSYEQQYELQYRDCEWVDIDTLEAFMVYALKY